MAKLAIIATLKTASGRRDESLKHLRAHAERCRTNEPGTLQFEILTPHDDPDGLMLYEVYADPETFRVHRNGESMKQMRLDSEGLHASLVGTRCELLEW